MCAPPLTFHYVHAIQSEHIPNTSDVLDFSRETRCVVGALPAMSHSPSRAAPST
ncbi:hypothetical protein B0H14DRAFT_3453413 [Mycena olivaceomarginata]|nr:hypothetical protein B0H14DRAFT_3453413 [Mycena olivaceomarginata]